MPHKRDYRNVLGTSYHDDYDPEEYEESAGAEYSSEDEAIGSDDYYDSEESVGSEEFSSEEEQERISAKPKNRSSSTVIDSDPVEIESVSLNGDKDWQRIRIACRKSYTISDKENDSRGDGSVISFRLCEEHEVPPWEKLGDSFNINGESILGNVHLTQVQSTLPASIAFVASMKDPKDGTERVTPNLVLPKIDRAVSGLLAKGQTISATDEPITLIEAPAVLKPTFLSKMEKEWTHNEIKKGIQPELGRPDLVRLHKSNPVLLSYLLTKKMYCKERGMKWDAYDHVEESGKECFLMPKVEADKKYEEIVADSKKNTTADFFYKNFKMDFVRGWTDGHAKDSCASNIGDETELFENVSSEKAKESMKKTTHSIAFEIEADFYTGKLSESLKF